MSLEFVCAHPKLKPISEHFEFYKTLMNWQNNLNLMLIVCLHSLVMVNALQE